MKIPSSPDVFGLRARDSEIPGANEKHFNDKHKKVEKERRRGFVVFCFPLANILQKSPNTKKRKNEEDSLRVESPKFRTP